MTFAGFRNLPKVFSINFVCVFTKFFHNNIKPVSDLLGRYQAVFYFNKYTATALKNRKEVSEDRKQHANAYKYCT